MKPLSGGLIQPKEKQMNNSTNHPKRLTWCLALSLSVLAVGCGGGGQDPILGADVAVFTPPAGSIIPGATCSIAGATIPRVTISTPTNGSLSTSTSTAGTANNGKLITATFSLDMNAATINAASFLVAPTGSAALVPAAVTYTVGSRVATFQTASALLANTAYTAVVLNTVTSAAGTPMGCSYAWNFRTAAAPVAGNTSSDFLGRVAPFAIASAAGVNNNPGITRINGDAVLSPTASCNGNTTVPGGAGIAGFGACGGNPPNIVGTVVTPTNPDTTTASAIMADLRTAYNSIMKANLPNATVLGCGTIGTGGGGGAGIGCAGNATLAPGVYISSTDSSIGVTGTLTLDGQGDANARFIFQAPSSTLTTATGNPGAPGSVIRLINGAKASNVFWQVGSSATIGTYSQFQGNVLADTSITLQTDATSCGRLLAGAVTTSGAFTFASNTVSVPGHPSAPAGCE